MVKWQLLPKQHFKRSPQSIRSPLASQNPCWAKAPPCSTNFLEHLMCAEKAVIGVMPPRDITLRNLNLSTKVVKWTLWERSDCSRSKPKQTALGPLLPGVLIPIPGAPCNWSQPPIGQLAGCMAGGPLELLLPVLPSEEVIQAHSLQKVFKKSRSFSECIFCSLVWTGCSLGTRARCACGSQLARCAIRMASGE